MDYINRIFSKADAIHTHTYTYPYTQKSKKKTALNLYEFDSIHEFNTKCVHAHTKKDIEFGINTLEKSRVLLYILSFSLMCALLLLVSFKYEKWMGNSKSKRQEWRQKKNEIVSDAKMFDVNTVTILCFFFLSFYSSFISFPFEKNFFFIFIRSGVSFRIPYASCTNFVANTYRFWRADGFTRLYLKT